MEIWLGVVEEIYIDKIALTLCRKFRQETVWVKPELVVEQIMAFVLHFLKIGKVNLECEKFMMQNILLYEKKLLLLSR